MIFQGRFSIFLMQQPSAVGNKTSLLIVFLIVLSLRFGMFMPICERQADTAHSGGDYVRVVTASGKRDGAKIQCRIFQ